MARFRRRSKARTRTRTVVKYRTRRIRAAFRRARSRVSKNAVPISGAVALGSIGYRMAYGHAGFPGVVNWQGNEAQGTPAAMARVYRALNWFTVSTTGWWPGLGNPEWEGPPHAEPRHLAITAGAYLAGKGIGIAGRKLGLSRVARAVGVGRYVRWS